MIGSSWFSCCVGDKYKGVTSQFVMPSHTKGKPFTSFLGGSDLAVPIGATRASRWTGSRRSPTRRRSGPSRPRGTSRTPRTCWGTPVNERAAVRSWTVPTAKNWVNVENGNILRNMLTQILTGKLTVKQAAASASDNITSVLNG